jgi:hypothetical protein
MNSKGQVLFLKFMIGLAIIIVILALAPVLKETNELSMDSDNLDCDNDSISDFDKTTCVSTDLSLFLYVGVIVFSGIAVFLIRRLTLK